MGHEGPQNRAGPPVGDQRSPTGLGCAKPSGLLANCVNVAFRKARIGLDGLKRRATTRGVWPSGKNGDAPA